VSAAARKPPYERIFLLTVSLRLRRATRFGVVLALVVVFGSLFVSSGGAATKAASEETPWSWPGAVLLSVETTPTGDAAGSVRSDPYLVDCPGACTRPYQPGSKVSLTEAPTHGFTFTSWSGVTCDEGQTASTCTFVISKDTHVVADYSGKYDPSPVGAPCCTLTVNVSGFIAGVWTSGDNISCVTDFLAYYYGIPNRCSATFAPGTDVTLYPEGCDNFLGWSDTGAVNYARTFTMNSNISVGAIFDGSC
jgi:hypothetical protein